MKFPAENPWNGAAEKYAVGNVVKGKVARMTDFGAFVELAPGVDALLHVSQIAKEHIEKPSDVLKVGQEIEAKIVDFNEDEKKISLSIKALLAPETNESEDAEIIAAVRWGRAVKKNLSTTKKRENIYKSWKHGKTV